MEGRGRDPNTRPPSPRVFDGRTTVADRWKSGGGRPRNNYRCSRERYVRNARVSAAAPSDDAYTPLSSAAGPPERAYYTHTRARAAREHPVYAHAHANKRAHTRASTRTRGAAARAHVGTETCLTRRRGRPACIVCARRGQEWDGGGTKLISSHTCSRFPPSRPMSVQYLRSSGPARFICFRGRACVSPRRAPRRRRRAVFVFEIRSLNSSLNNRFIVIVACIIINRVQDAIVSPRPHVRTRSVCFCNFVVVGFSRRNATTIVDRFVVVGICYSFFVRIALSTIFHTGKPRVRPTTTIILRVYCRGVVRGA